MGLSQVAAPKEKHGCEDVAAIRSLNDTIAADPRVNVLLIPIGDGVSFVQKLGERQISPPGPALDRLV